MNGRILIREMPSLRQPYLVAGFSGWVDGGQAATGTVKYLVRKLDATPFAEIPVADFNVFQMPGVESLRPHSKTEDGVITEFRPPRNELFYWKKPGPGPGHDLVLLQGVEPQLRWPEFIGEVLDLAQRLGVGTVYSVGAVLGGVPHTREPAVSCAVSHPALKRELEQFKVRYSNYEGPATFNTALLVQCRERGLKAVHFNGRAVYYPEFGIVVAYNPMVMLALLKRLRVLLGVDVDLSDLESASRELVERLNGLETQSAKLREYVAELERNFTEMRYEPPISGAPEEIVRDAEEFLRRQRGEEPK
ncbi:MAG: PAC2 family protein [Chloroflexi bacterium]|nr:PAC2 family protein [Chloroflexota bacterium]